jgi:hypothetical protein
LRWSDPAPEQFWTPLKEPETPYFDAQPDPLDAADNAVQPEEWNLESHPDTDETTSWRNKARGDDTMSRSNVAMLRPTKGSLRTKPQARRSEPLIPSDNIPIPTHLILQNLFSSSNTLVDSSSEASSTESSHSTSGEQRSTRMSITSEPRAQSSISGVLPEESIDTPLKRFLSGLDESDGGFRGHRDSLTVARSRLLRKRNISPDLFQLKDAVAIAQKQSHVTDHAQPESEFASAKTAIWNPQTSSDAAIMTCPLPDSWRNREELWDFMESTSGSVHHKEHPRGHIHFVGEN